MSWNVPTWVYESTIALAILVSVPLLTAAPWHEWVGVFAVWFSFKHASVADRLSEAERLRHLQDNTSNSSVDDSSGTDNIVPIGVSHTKDRTPQSSRL